MDEKNEKNDVLDVNQEQDQTKDEPKVYSEQELKERLEAQRKEINENNQKAWNTRWGREKTRIEEENAKKDELVQLMMKKTDSKSLDEVLDISYANYGEERPKNTRVNLKDDEVLGKHDASEILNLDFDSIKEEADRLGSISRSTREDVTYKELIKYIEERSHKEKIKKEIQDNGIDEKILEDTEFLQFAENFKEGVSMKTIYDTYSKTKTPVVEDKPKTNNKPFSPGSMKSNYTENVVKDYYTFEEAKALKKEDYLQNPELFEIIEKSKKSWKK